jgi:hypothetical protein
VHRSEFDDVIRGPFTHSSRTRLCPEATTGVAEYQSASLIISAVEHTVPFSDRYRSPCLTCTVSPHQPGGWWTQDRSFSLQLQSCTSSRRTQSSVAVLYVFKKNSVICCRLVRLQELFSRCRLVRLRKIRKSGALKFSRLLPLRRKLVRIGFGEKC